MWGTGDPGVQKAAGTGPPIGNQGQDPPCWPLGVLIWTPGWAEEASRVTWTWGQWRGRGRGRRRGPSRPGAGRPCSLGGGPGGTTAWPSCCHVPPGSSAHGLFWWSVPVRCHVLSDPLPEVSTIENPRCWRVDGWFPGAGWDPDGRLVLGEQGDPVWDDGDVLKVDFAEACTAPQMY